MKLIFLPINQAWCFVFGKSINDYTLLKLDKSPMLYNSREAAVRETAFKGITVDKEGNCK